jgi:hypothetical protein
LVFVSIEVSHPSVLGALQSAHPAAQAHAPAVQLAFEPHAWLHVPQLFTLSRSDSHPFALWPSQSPKPVAHVHVPATHATFTPQACPHVPQFIGSFCVFEHDVPHSVPLVQLAAQVPPAQSGVPVGHVFAHRPQCCATARLASQPLALLPSQSSKPVTHTQCPALHMLFAPHRTPHAPQLTRLEVTSVSQPLSRFPSQSPVPSPQAHAPIAHSVPEAHIVEQVPQWRRSSASDASQPFPVSPSHSAKVGAQVHMPFAQTWCSPHWTLHAPQCVASLVTSTSHPFDSSPSQFTCPAGHAHTPWLHVAPTAHATSHAPQLAGSSASDASQPVTALPSQSRKPKRHTFVQLPDAHVVPGHTIPQAPQLCGSRSRSIEHASAPASACGRRVGSNGNATVHDASSMPMTSSTDAGTVTRASTVRVRFRSLPPARVGA